MNFSQDITDDSVISTILHLSEISTTDRTSDKYHYPATSLGENRDAELEILRSNLEASNYPQHFIECSSEAVMSKKQNCRYSVDREECYRNHDDFSCIDTRNDPPQQCIRESQTEREDIQPSKADCIVRAKKTGRKRHSFTEEQSCELEKVFGNVKYPSREVMKDLSFKHDLTFERIKNWFQNKRARLKKQIRFEKSFTSRQCVPATLPVLPVYFPNKLLVPCAEASTSSPPAPPIPSKMSGLNLVASTCMSWTRTEPITTSCETKHTSYPTHCKLPTHQWNNYNYLQSSTPNAFCCPNNITLNNHQQCASYSRFLSTLQDRYLWFYQQASMSGVVPQVYRNANPSPSRQAGEIKHSVTNILTPGFMPSIAYDDHMSQISETDSLGSTIPYSQSCFSPDRDTVVDLSASSPAEKQLQDKELLYCSNALAYNKVAVSRYDDIGKV